MNINMESLAITLAAIAIIMTFINLIPVMVGVFDTRNRNRLSALPMPVIEFMDYSDKPISIAIQNHGYGPVRILKSYIDYNGVKKPSSFDFIEEFNFIDWHEYQDNIDGRIILPTKDLILLEFTIKPGGEKQESELRKKLSQATIVVHYTDIFNSKYKPLKRTCSWFGRNL